MYRTFSLRELSSNVLRRGVSARETSTETAMAAAKVPSRLPRVMAGSGKSRRLTREVARVPRIAVGEIGCNPALAFMTWHTLRDEAQQQKRSRRPNTA